MDKKIIGITIVAILVVGTALLFTLTKPEETEKHSLTINIEGEGETTPIEGTHTYEEGENVTITAEPDGGWLFEEWTGDKETTSTEITIEMDSDKEVTAHFKEKDPGIEYYDLTINIEGEGTTEPEEGTHTYEEGIEVNLIALPEENWEFKNWTGDHESEEKEINITIDNDKSITALFEESEFAPEPNYNLTISTEGEGTTNPETGTYEYEEGEEVGITAEANEGHEFVEWTGNIENIDEPSSPDTTITMEGHYSITANFQEEDIEMQDLKISLHGEGKVEINDEVIEESQTKQYEDGEELEVEAIPDDGWIFQGWETNGSANECDSQDPECVFVITESSLLSPHFEEFTIE